MAFTPLRLRVNGSTVKDQDRRSGAAHGVYRAGTPRVRGCELVDDNDGMFVDSVDEY